MSAGEPWTAADREKPGKIGAGEAARLTKALRKANGTRRSSLSVVQLLLRLTHGPLAIERSMSWIANETMLSERMTRYAIHDLVKAGVVTVVVRGDGRTRSHFLVNLELLRGLVEGGNSCRPGGQSLPGRGAIVAPPSARAREVLASYLKDPLPPEPATASKATATSPAASRGAPFFQTGDIDQPCQHGRTVSQGGCRACGTSPRQLADQAQRVRARSDLQRQREDQANRQAQEAALRASSTPPPADLRASIRKSRPPP